MKEKITLQKIAEKTGFSVNTVSHALNDKPDISEKTKEIIKETANSLGYIGNASACYLRSGKSKSIAIILGDITNPHFSIMVREIETCIREFGYTVFILNSEENEKNEHNAILSSIRKNVDGIIICPVQKTNKNIKLLEQTGVPFVLIGRHFDDMDTDYIVCDDINGGYIATKHLLNLGHKNILFLNGREYISSSKERFCGFKKAYKEFGIKFDKSLIHNGSARAGDCTSYINDIFSKRKDITAILAFSDLLAWEAVHTLNKIGLSVPHDISVVGFDNIGSKFLFPIELTSISSSKVTMAKTASEVLLKKINHDTEHKEQIVIDTKIIVRDTTIMNGGQYHRQSCKKTT